MIIRMIAIGFCFVFLMSHGIANAQMMPEQDNGMTTSTTANQTEQMKNSGATVVPYLPGYKKPKTISPAKKGWVCRCIYNTLDDFTQWSSSPSPKSGNCSGKDYAGRMIYGVWECKEAYY